jgi:hypothetical protein
MPRMADLARPYNSNDRACQKAVPTTNQFMIPTALNRTEGRKEATAIGQGPAVDA